MLGMSRREFLLGSAATFAASSTTYAIAKNALSADLQLPLNYLSHEIVPGKITEHMMGFGIGGPAPTIRFKQHQTKTIDVVNNLREASIVHWHGLRHQNDMDGVPYLTQKPIEMGERFRYNVTSPDAGTFWYHPHCNTLDQMGRGMTGLLIVEELEDPGFDHDLALNIRDFRLGTDGQFVAMFKPRLAARGGTLGTVSTVNWQVQPTYDFPAGSLVRLRLAVTDVTRVGNYQISGADAHVIALDSHPVPQPLPASDILLAPGQRADVALRMPDKEGEVAELFLNILSGPRLMATFRSVGPSLGRSLAELKQLPRNPVKEPDLANAEILDFTFGWTPDGAEPLQSICGSLGYVFWSINRKPWLGDTPGPLDPLATMKLGKSYILRLRNNTPNDHPIHLHGLAFKLIRSDKRQLPPLFTDTALLQSGETMDVALVADNPGYWAFHCHVIEHQKTGLTGYLRVEG
ncbi:multicopper oxidase family protein [uncultured Maritalea sp.]|uniref:multicopper oxidase family protein n=1 Tax=uncultured Maritalea sp. TaxID=757249 RepID=UPI002614BD3A|nr:multicopper oxidase family protein [uncultured Maritalea sp.]